AKSQLPELETRLMNWETNPDNYVESFVTHKVAVPIVLPFEDAVVFPEHFYEDFRPKLPTGYGGERMWVAQSETWELNGPTIFDAYRQMVHLYGEKAEVREWQGWKKFEDQVVCQGIRFGLIKLPKKFLNVPSLK